MRIEPDKDCGFCKGTGKVKTSKIEIECICTNSEKRDDKTLRWVQAG